MSNGYFIGSDGRRREFDTKGRELGTQTGSMPAVRRPDAGTGATPAIAEPSTAQPMARAISQPRVEIESTHREPNPSGQRAAILDPRSTGGEMARRAEMASSDVMRMARASKGTYTRAQLAAAASVAGAGRDFWLDQARSISGDAHQRFLEAQKLRSQERQTGASLGNQQTIAAENNAARAAEGVADRTFQAGQGDADRAFRAGQGDADRGLRRSLFEQQMQAQQNAPQLVTADGGVMGYATPGGGFTSLRDHGGNPVLAPPPQIDPSLAIANINALARADAATLGSTMTPDDRAAQLVANADRYGGGQGSRQSQSDVIAQAREAIASGRISREDAMKRLRGSGYATAGL